MRLPLASFRLALATLAVALLLGSCETPVEPVAVGAVVVTPSAVTKYPTQTQQLTAVVQDDDGATLTDRPVTWASSNEAAATVSATGLVTAIAAGASNITATAGGVAGTSVFTVINVPVDSVHVTPGAATRHPGQTVQLTATTYDSIGGLLTGRTITWGTGNNAVATVNGSGLVTAVAVGATTITATSEGVPRAMTITVVAVPVDSVHVTPMSSTRHIGQTLQLTAATLDSVGGTLGGRSVVWASSDSAVATVNGSGLVTAIALGTATLTATSEGKVGSATLSVVIVPVDSVVVTPSAATRLIGQTIALSAQTLDSAGGVLAGRAVEWSSSDSTKATVNSGGLVTAVALGTVTISATSEGKVGTSQITVAPVPVAEVILVPASATRYQGQTVQLTATPRDSVGNPLPGRVVTWASLNASIATVDASGLVTAVDVGMAMITATSEGKADTSTITVNAVPVDSVAITPPSATRHPGQTVQLTATMYDSAGNVLTGRARTWSTTDAAVATVGPDGLVTAVDVGVALIILASELKLDTATITVTAVPVATVDITPDSVDFEIGDTLTFTAVARDSIGGVLVGRTITWSALDAARASVNASGLVTAVSAGLARIVATSEGRADTAMVVVAAAPSGVQVVGPFDVHVTGSEDHAQGVASDGVNALYAIQTASFGTANNMLFLTLVDSTGATLVAETPLGVGGDPPAVAYGGGVYLVASWLPNSETHTTSAWIVASDLSSIGSKLDLQTGPETAEVCGAEYAGGTFVVTYAKVIGQNDDLDQLTAVFGRTVSTSGVLGSEFQVSPGYAACGFAINGMLASDGTGFLSVWAPVDSATGTEGIGVQVRTISSAGALGTVQTVTAAASLGRVLNVASRAGGGWVVGMGEMMNETTADFDATVQLLAADGSNVGGLITLDNTLTSVVPSVSEWDGGFVVVLIERPAIAADQVVKLQRFDASGTSIGVTTLATVDGASKVPVALSLYGHSRIFVVLEYFTPGSNLLNFDEATGDVRGVLFKP